MTVPRPTSGRQRDYMNYVMHMTIKVYTWVTSPSTEPFPMGFILVNQPPSSRPLKGDWRLVHEITIGWSCVTACDSLGQSLYSTSHWCSYIPTSGRGVCAVWFMSEHMIINQSNKHFLSAHYVQRIKSVWSVSSIAICTGHSITSAAIDGIPPWVCTIHTHSHTNMSSSVAASKLYS